MRAYVLHGPGDLRFEEIAEPEIKPDEVLLEVKAMGICGSDIPRIYGGGAYSYPLIPGHEFSGVVTETGKAADRRWLGKRVGVYPMEPCMHCECCMKKKFELCRNYNYLGSRTNGGFAEFVAVPEKNLIALPDAVSFEAAAMLEPMAVAVHAIRRAKLQTDDAVVVCGLGTIGLMLIMFLKEMGIKKILAVGNKQIQKCKALSLGIEEEAYIDSGLIDLREWVLNNTDGGGVEVFFECVGKNETINDAVQCTSPDGMVLLVGNPASDIAFEKNIYWKILRNQLTVKGSWNSSFTQETDDDWHYVLDRLEKGYVSPEQYITGILPFDRLEAGMLDMRDKRKEYIKVMAVR